MQMILEKETKAKFGYFPSNLKPRSSKRILAKCDDCGVVREIAKCDYRNLCHRCVKKTKHLSAETRLKLSEGHKGIRPTEETRHKRSESFKGDKNPRFGKRGPKVPNWKGGKVKRICLECGAIFFSPPAWIKKGGGNFCSRSCSRRHRTFPTHHTKPELIFEAICKKHDLPFHFVGDGSLWIGKEGERQLNPDFIEANGKKICVEIMGDYWHSPLLNGKIKEYATLEYRKRHFKRYKWHPIFIWESDLKRKDAEAFVLNILKRENKT